MHAIVTNIDIELGRSSEATAMLNQLAVPQAQAAAGFITGYWMRSADHAQGTSVGSSSRRRPRRPRSRPGRPKHRPTPRSPSSAPG